MLKFYLSDFEKKLSKSKTKRRDDKHKRKVNLDLRSRSIHTIID